MASDLQRFLAREPVSVYSENLAERFERWMLRHWRKVGYGIAAIAVSLLVAFAVSKRQEVEKLNHFARAREQIEEFKQLCSEAHFLITSSDLKSAESPYYQVHAGEEVGHDILDLVEGWGNGFEQLQLSDDDVTNRKSRDLLWRDYYDLQLLLLQSKLNNSSDKMLAHNCLVQLKNLNGRIAPTRAYRLLEELCYRKLGSESLAIEARNLADAADVPITYLDHFLLGESLRQRTKNIDRLDPDGQDRSLQGLLEQAIEEFELAIESKPDHYWSYLQIGRCLMALGRYEDSIRSFGAAIALRPEAPWAFTSRSLAIALAGDCQKAIGEMNRLITKSVEVQPSVFLTRGYIHLLNQDEQASLKDFERVMQLDEAKRLIGAAYYRAVILSRNGEQSKAIADLEWIIKRDPSFAPAYLERANILFSCMRIDDALSDLDQYLRVTISEPDFRSWRVYYARGLLISKALDSLQAEKELASKLEDELLKQLRNAISLGGDAENLYREVGRLLYLRGDMSGALAVYEEGRNAVRHPRRFACHWVGCSSRLSQREPQKYLKMQSTKARRNRKRKQLLDMSKQNVIRRNLQRRLPSRRY